MYSSGDPMRAAADDTFTMDPPIPPRFVDMRRHRLAAAKEAADDVRVQHALPARRVHVLEAHVVLEDARVVDEARDGAKLAIAFLEHVDDVALLRHVRAAP
jgi:hypothetical protein